MTETPRQRPPRQPLVEPGGIDHHFTDMTVTVSVNPTLAELQSKLAEHDQWLPIDGNPKLPLRALVESNSTGPLRLGYGAWRDLLLGCQFATPKGELITAGGRTMKNVAGYDLTKFMVGQYGQFGQLLTITTRTYKRPKGALLVRCSFTHDLIGRLLPTPARPQWAMMTHGTCNLGYFGDERAIAFYESIARQFGAGGMKRQSLEEDIEFRAANWLPKRLPLQFRASVPPTRVGEFLKNAQTQDYAADPVFGIIVGSYPAHQKAVLSNVAKDAGGRVFFDDDADHKHFADATDAEIKLLERLQSAFTQ